MSGVEEGEEAELSSVCGSVLFWDDAMDFVSGLWCLAVCAEDVRFWL